MEPFSKRRNKKLLISQEVLLLTGIRRLWLAPLRQKRMYNQKTRYFRIWFVVERTEKMSNQLLISELEKFDSI